MTQTEASSARDAAPEIDNDPLAASDPNPAYLAALQGRSTSPTSVACPSLPAPSPTPSAATSSAPCSAASSPPATA